MTTEYETARPNPSEMKQAVKPQSRGFVRDYITGERTIASLLSEGTA